MLPCDDKFEYLFYPYFNGLLCSIEESLDLDIHLCNRNLLIGGLFPCCKQSFSLRPIHDLSVWHPAIKLLRFHLICIFADSFSAVKM